MFKRENRIYCGGNGDPSVVYTSKDVDGEKTEKLKINGKEVDLNNPDDIEEAIKHFESCKYKPASSLLKMMGVNLNTIYDKAIETLEEHKQKLLESKEAEDEDEWEKYDIDFDKTSHSLAYKYLSETKDGFTSLPVEEQAKHIKTVADVFDWTEDYV